MGPRARLATAQTADYETMARALATIGACDEAVNYDRYGKHACRAWGRPQRASKA